MRRYETMIIVDPDLSDEQREPLLERIEETISARDGVLVMFDNWGNQKLSYEVRKKARGHYVRIDYCGEGELVAELERTFRIDDRVMKFMTVLLEENVDPEKIKAEISAAESPETPAEETAEGETSEEEAKAEAGETEEASEETAEAETSEEEEE